MPTSSHLKLGLLVLAGLFLLVSTLYIIGKNENYFGAHFQLRARFTNANGLISGDNIRFSGLQAGTVRTIHVIDDTTIEVVLLIDKAMRPYIHKNALASIGTEGLIGNKVVNIIPAAPPAPLAEDGDLLPVQNQVNTDDMLRTLNKTNENIAAISEGLNLTIHRINNSPLLWRLSNDTGLILRLNASLDHLHDATANADAALQNLHTLTADLNAGKGSVGSLLRDTTFAHNLDEAVNRLKLAGERISAAGDQAGALAQNANALIKDSNFIRNLNSSLDNIRQGTAAFHEDMEALKHNFLLRGYFRRQEKAAAKKAGAKTLPSADQVTN